MGHQQPGARGGEGVGGAPQGALGDEGEGEKGGEGGGGGGREVGASPG